MKRIEVPFAPPHINEESIQEVVDTLRSGWITTGPKTKMFEEKLQEFLGGGKIVCVGSATQGMELILRWFGVGPGDEVIVPAYTYCATANIILHCGATPVMVDVLEDFQISPIEIEKKINKNTKVIIPVDIGGYPCDYDRIFEVANGKSSLFEPSNEAQIKLGRILVMGDSAHSFGAKYKDKKIGVVADIGVFSFHAVKNLTTAEGGAISLNLSNQFNLEGIQQDLKTLSLHGQNKDAFKKTQKGGWRYDVEMPGFKCNMTDIQASLGLGQLKTYEDNIRKRQEVFNFYNRSLKDFSWAQLPPMESKTRCTSYHVYMLRINGVGEDERDRIIDYMHNEFVSVNVHFKPLPLLTAYRKLGYDISEYPIAYDSYKREISLPVFFDISVAQLERVVEVLQEAVSKVLNLKN